MAAADNLNRIVLATFGRREVMVTVKVTRLSTGPARKTAEGPLAPFEWLTQRGPTIVTHAGLRIQYCLKILACQ